jgi:hypothetical protein
VTDKDVVRAVLQALEKAGIAYMIVGSLSSNAYGIARSTQDADFVIDADGEAISRLSRHLPASLILDPQVTFETVTGTHRVIVMRKRSKFKVELFFISDDPHDRERFRRRIRGHTHDRCMWLPTPKTWSLPSYAGQEKAIEPRTSTTFAT